MLLHFLHAAKHFERGPKNGQRQFSGNGQPTASIGRLMVNVLRIDGEGPGRGKSVRDMGVRALIPSDVPETPVVYI
jgi:hypothetical protein